MSASASMQTVHMICNIAAGSKLLEGLLRPVGRCRLRGILSSELRASRI